MTIEELVLQQDQAVGAAHRRLRYAKMNANATSQRIAEIAGGLRLVADELDERTPLDGYRPPPKVNWERTRELVNVPIDMPAVPLVVGAVVAVLHQRPEALQAVHMDLPLDVLALRVIT